MKEIDEQSSQMDAMRLKAINPDFLAECEAESRKTNERNRELAYAELLKQRVRDEAMLRNRIRTDFEKECV